MTKTRSRILALALALSCAVLSPAALAQAAPVELTVFAAASLTETLTQIAERYQLEHPDVSIVFNFDSSGTLKTQIQEGAPCDLFISAGQKQMNQLDIASGKEQNPDGLDLVAEGTRVDLLENRVALVVPEGSGNTEISGFDALAKALENRSLLLAMGNSDVPVGQYTQKILAYYGLDEAALAKDGCVTYCSNVKEVVTQVIEASVDCGVVYGTDAYSAGLTPVGYATPDMCGQVIYPAAVMKNAAQPEAAKAFLDALAAPEAMAAFEAVGFAPVK